MTDSLRSLAPEGRLLVLGFAGGEIPVVKVNRLLLGNTGVLGVASREFFEQRPAPVGELWDQLMELWRTRVSLILRWRRMRSPTHGGRCGPSPAGRPGARSC